MNLFIRRYRAPLVHVLLFFFFLFCFAPCVVAKFGHCYVVAGIPLIYYVSMVVVSLYTYTSNPISTDFGTNFRNQNGKKCDQCLN